MGLVGLVWIWCEASVCVTHLFGINLFFRHVVGVNRNAKNRSTDPNIRFFIQDFGSDTVLVFTLDPGQLIIFFLLL